MKSRAMITITIHAGILFRSDSAMSAEHTSSLSARGSMNFPKLVTRLYFLAIFPSSISVSDAAMNIPSATHFDHPGDIYKNTRKNGIIIALSIVNLFGKFILLSLLSSHIHLPRLSSHPQMNRISIHMVR